MEMAGMWYLSKHFLSSANISLSIHKNEKKSHEQHPFRNIGDLRIPLYTIIQQHNLNSLFSIEPSIRGMAYQVTCAAHHRSVLSRINYDSCICLSHSFQIYVVGMSYDYQTTVQ